MIDFAAREKEMRQNARKMLESGEVKYVIGYEKGGESAVARPAFARTPDDTENLCWDPTCVSNLTKYLVEEVQIKPKRGEEPDIRPVGIVVSPAIQKPL